MPRLRTSRTRPARLAAPRILELIHAAFAIRDAHPAGKLDEDQVVLQGLALACYLEELTGGCFRYEPNRRLAKHLKKHIWQWFWFLIEPGIDTTNWRAEQAIRPAVVNRKVWGGNRTWLGVRAPSSLLPMAHASALHPQAPSPADRVTLNNDQATYNAAAIGSSRWKSYSLASVSKLGNNICIYYEG